MTDRATVASLLEPLLTYKQVGDLLGVTDRTVWKLVDLGQLPAVRVGRSVRIDPRDLRRFIEQAKGGEEGTNAY